MTDLSAAALGLGATALGAANANSQIASYGRSAAQAFTVYQPTITPVMVMDGPNDVSGYVYNHDSAIIEFGGYWFCFWNANTDGAEGANGQYILMKRAATFEGLAAASAVKCFGDAAYCTNPIDASLGAQWQPAAVILGGVLYVLWSQSGSNVGIYSSALTDPAGKFSTTTVTSGTITKRGVPYNVWYPTGDIATMTTAAGKVRALCPIILYSNSTTVPTGSMPSGVATSSVTRAYKMAGVLIRDEGDAAWRIGGLIDDPATHFSPWEPTISIAPSGVVRMYCRSFDTSQVAGKRQFVSYSFDEGLSFTALQYSGLEMPSARAAVLNRDASIAPSIMVQSDNAGLTGAQGGADARRNMALWLGTGDNDFTPGIQIADDATYHVSSYPSAYMDTNGDLIVTFSTQELSPKGFCSRIRGLRISPAPSYGALMMRANARTHRTPYYTASPYAHFYYLAHSKMQTLGTMAAVSASVQTVMGICNLSDPGLLMDSRKGTTGAVVRVAGTRLYAGLFNGSTYTDIDSGLNIVLNSPFFWSARFDTTAQTVTFDLYDDANGYRTAVINYGFVAGALNPTGPLAVYSSSSATTGLNASVGMARFMKVYGSTLTLANLRYIQNAHAAAVGMTSWSGTATAPAAADFDFDATNPNADATGGNSTWRSVWLQSNQCDGDIQVVTRNSRPAVKFRGTASLGLAPITRNFLPTHFSFQYEAIAGRNIDSTICTVGDAINNLMLVKTVAGDLVSRTTVAGVVQADVTLFAAPSDGELYRVQLLFGTGTITVNHEGYAPQTVTIACRPIVMFGKGWGPSNSVQVNTGNITNGIYVYTDSVYSKGGRLDVA